jgi:phenylpyruvate tautomerase PptA (4-oxalocrotonate tautomerase family)
MPHANVTLYPGRWAEEKAELARAITKDVTTILKRAR